MTLFSKDMWIKLFLIIIFCLSGLAFAEEVPEPEGEQPFTPELTESIKKLVEDVPVQDQELREIRDAANIWKRDSDNSQIELREAAALDMRSKQIDNVLDPTAAQNAATKNYVDTNADMLYTDTRFKVGNFTRDISLTTDQPITGVGFTPKGLILLCARSGSSLVIGAGDGTTVGSAYHFGADASFDPNTAHIIHIFVDASNYAKATLQSLDADGFTLDWTDKINSPTGTATITYIAWR